LFEEPTDALDHLSRTVPFRHDGVEGFADRVGILSKGRLAVDEDPASLSRRFRRITYRNEVTETRTDYGTELDAFEAVRVRVRGWGVEATRLALAYAMDTLDPHRVEAKVYAYNVLSINALRRNGFHLEGTLREARIYDGRRWDVLVYSILDSELRTQRTRDNFAPMGLWPAGDASA